MKPVTGGMDCGASPKPELVSASSTLPQSSTTPAVRQKNRRSPADLLRTQMTGAGNMKTKELIDWLDQIAKEFGSRGALAKAMGVHQQSLEDCFLSGKIRPAVAKALNIASETTWSLSC